MLKSNIFCSGLYFLLLPIFSINPSIANPKIKIPDFIENFIIPKDVINACSEFNQNVIFYEYGYERNPITNEISKEESIIQIICASSSENDILLEPTLIDFSSEGYRQILNAESGYHNKSAGIFIFTNGQIEFINTYGETTSSITFETYSYNYFDKE